MTRTAAHVAITAKLAPHQRNSLAVVVDKRSHGRCWFAELRCVRTGRTEGFATVDPGGVCVDHY